MRPLFPTSRPRRLRYNSVLREMISETSLSLNDFIMPLFVRPGKEERVPIQSMPGNFQLSVDELVKECKELSDLGIKAVLLFGIPETKDEDGTVATHDHSIVQQGIRAIKKELPDMYIIADVCNCEYTTHGHCGTIIDGDVDNDSTLITLANQSVSLARAGADMIAPSDMMDGRIGAIRKALDENGYEKTPIMAYSAKFASAFYGPFRDAAESAPQFGDRRTYQMDFRNGDEALREIEADIAEGADIVMVKPALSFMDVIARAKDRYNVPMAAYNVSGEFSMVKAASENGWVDEDRIIMEIMYSLKRAGTDLIISYHSKRVSEILNNK
ncbi:porphobilinogen synthase [Balneicella halophila]|uniref:Delta-aminolevulinic acid dehydratase n=1 Tax=Balneicella halophila TaxID=1537566 RepID=A0A7L4URQ1_BALHA|nr:porphobilinogen synthase [Balneicella halophila]PVX52455.1 porphobilinogen synthase [Balneicella halophila]